MAPFRMPFASRRPLANGTVEPVNDENSRPGVDGQYKPSLALGVKERRDEPNEFKMSSVSDTGEYMPPSPIEKKSFWSKSPAGSSTNHRSMLSETEPFSISRESFESYRRSFDVTGRSPIIHADSYTSRSSFDSRLSKLPGSSLNNDRSAKAEPPNDQDFEDVGLNDDQATKPKKRGFLSRFADSTDQGNHATTDGKQPHFSMLSGRKRGQSGSGNELGTVERPTSKDKTDPMPR